ncbi:molybdopterin molybdotransferase MoeA [Paenibacillus sp. GYB003]|uniref:molybdopterin molybdotransferase MoeA n=1 Tax=Paenibacillus sp. GYB003 TaxID=2994392 RepID=UPI002F962ED4
MGAEGTAKFGRTGVTVEEAQRRIAERIGIGCTGTERVGLLEAFGRRLAEPIFADAPLPHFRRSGLDGYAVRAADTAGATPQSPARLRVTETIACGAVPAADVAPGTAARIMTGAAVPEGADAVVMLEMTEAEDRDGVRFVLVGKPMEPGANVAGIGGEAETGRLVLEAGSVVSAGETAVLAAFGHSVVTVARRPKVAIVATGAELLPVDAPAPLAPGRVRDSNSAMVAALVREAGGTPILWGAVDDDPSAAAFAVRSALAEADAVVTTGGVSVGDYDVMTDFCRTWDGELLFDKVLMRPGSPTSAGVRDGRPLFMLSGNPGACYVGFELLVRGALLLMQRSSEPAYRAVQAVLGEGQYPGIALRRYVRGRCHSENGTLVVVPTGADKSSHLVSLPGTDCLIVVPPGGRGVRAGDAVSALVRRHSPFA